MATTSNSRGSVRTTVTKRGNGPTMQQGGQLDIIAPKNTGYPVICNPRKEFVGNGPTPGNPFGKTFPDPLGEV